MRGPESGPCDHSQVQRHIPEQTIDHPPPASSSFTLHHPLPSALFWLQSPVLGEPACRAALWEGRSREWGGQGGCQVGAHQALCVFCWGEKCWGRRAVQAHMGLARSHCLDLQSEKSRVSLLLALKTGPPTPLDQ